MTRSWRPLLGVGIAVAAASCGGATRSGPAPTPSPSPATGPAGEVRFTVDTGAGRAPIPPYIYGANQVEWNGRRRFLRSGRLGGNRWTAYNWENNASNAGADFQHQNDGFLGGGDVAGEAVRGPWW